MASEVFYQYNDTTLTERLKTTSNNRIVLEKLVENHNGKLNHCKQGLRMQQQH
jgi:hypothetical protein